MFLSRKCCVLIFKDKMSQEMHVGVCGIAHNLCPSEEPVTVKDLH